MAAHPFGPIEKFLVVAHKSPGFDPRKVKIGYWQEKLVKFPDPVTDPVWAFAATDAERFWVEPTAIINSRDYEVRFAGLSSGQDLLSRGLGYRITFTMPADREFDVSLPTTWPQIEIKFLDCFGTKILGTLDKITKQNHLLNVGNFLRNEARLVEYLLGFQTVEIESTFLGLKITENSVT